MLWRLLVRLIFRGCRRSLLILFFFLPVVAFAQTDSLRVIFEQVTIDPTQLFRSLNPGFPHPVISVITVKDTNQRYVHGLADTSRWIGPSDTTETGMPVDSVWKHILEYHEEDPALPADPDVKNTTPEYQVTELYDVEGFGLSIALIMDYSGSMQEDIYISEDAARVLVRQMNSSDRAAIVKFTGKVQIFQEFTSDTTLLMEAIVKPPTSRDFTSLFDALYTGVNLCLSEESRKAVVAYTDGMDNFSSHSIDDVIALAKENEIPVFMIGLGGGVNENNLRRIAEETGGIYLYAESAEELASIYIYISGLIHGYYIMAHSSPDPFHNNTWRIVDLTLHHDQRAGRGQGRYFVPFQPADLSVFKDAETDSMQVHGEDPVHVIPAQGQVSYNIRVTNGGPAIAGNIRIADAWPDDLQLKEFEFPPDTVTQDSIIWSISRLDPGEDFSFGYTAGADTLPFNELYPLINHVHVQCSSDTLQTNNADSAVVYYTPLLPVDISVSKRAFTDSVYVQEGDSVYYVLPGDTVRYQVRLTNQGEKDSDPVLCRDILPEQVTLMDFSGGGYTLQGDTLSWTGSGIPSGGENVQYTYTCMVDTVMPPWDVALVNAFTVQCAQDSFPENNTASDTVWAVGIAPPDPRVRVSPTVIEPADSVQVEVMTPIRVEEWDLTIRFQNGYQITDYADEYIQTVSLEPGKWTVVSPDFGETYMTVTDLEERVAVIFETTDQWGITRSATAYFTIKSSNAFYLGDNVFRPSGGVQLGLRFKLNSNRRAEIKIYDIAGHYIATAASGSFLAGWNQAWWDGKDSKGRSAGSGTYIAIISSGEFKKARKFILIR